MTYNYNCFLFFVWLLIVKTDKHLLLLLCNYYSLSTICIMIGQQQNKRTLYHQNYDLIEKPVITF